MSPRLHPPHLPRTPHGWLTPSSVTTPRARLWPLAKLDLGDMGVPVSAAALRRGCLCLSSWDSLQPQPFDQSPRSHLALQDQYGGWWLRCRPDCLRAAQAGGRPSIPALQPPRVRSQPQPAPGRTPQVSWDARVGSIHCFLCSCIEHPQARTRPPMPHPIQLYVHRGFKLHFVPSMDDLPAPGFKVGPDRLAHTAGGSTWTAATCCTFYLAGPNRAALQPRNSAQPPPCSLTRRRCCTCFYPCPTSSCTTLYTPPSVCRPCGLCLGAGLCGCTGCIQAARASTAAAAFSCPAALLIYRVYALPEFDGFSKLTMAAIPAGHPIL